jgi:hypothetical protein
MVSTDDGRSLNRPCEIKSTEHARFHAGAITLVRQTCGHHCKAYSKRGAPLRGTQGPKDALACLAMEDNYDGKVQSSGER